MAMINDDWLADLDVYHFSSAKSISKDDVIKYIKLHPEIMDEISKIIRNEKLKKLNKK